MATSDVNSADGDGYGVFFQRYDKDGNKVGEPQLANTTTEGNQFEADVAALNDGGYVLAWQSDVGDGSGNGVFMQRYDADGNKVGGETRVNTITEGNQDQVAITGLKDGGYVVSWQSDSSEDGKDIHLQKYDSEGKPVGGEVVVNEDVTANQVMPSIDALENGGFVVVWQSDSANSGQETYARAYNQDMSASSQIHIDSATEGDQTLPAVSGLSDGGFVTTWISHDESGATVNLQRFDSTGNPVGEERVVSELTDFNLFSNVTPEVTGLNDGGYVVVFSDKDSDGNGVYYQRYDANNNEVGDRVLLNTDEDSNQYNPHVTALDDGGFLTTWVNVSGDESSMEVVGQKFDADGSRHDSIFKVSEITTDEGTVHQLLASHEVNNIDTSVDLSNVDYLDFDGASKSEVQSDTTAGTAHHLDTTEITLSDLIADSGENEIQMNLPETAEQPKAPEEAHQIQPAVVNNAPEVAVEIDNIDNSHLMDIHNHQIVTDE